MPKEYSVQEVADALGINRSTLVRMEQRGEIEAARKKEVVVVARYYTEEDVASFKQRIAEGTLLNVKQRRSVAGVSHSTPSAIAPHEGD